MYQFSDGDCVRIKAFTQDDRTRRMSCTITDDIKPGQIYYIHGRQKLWGTMVWCLSANAKGNTGYIAEDLLEPSQDAPINNIVSAEMAAAFEALMGANR